MIPAQDVEALLARVAMGDRSAFKNLYDLTAGLLLATAYRVLQDKSQAEDVVQDVFAGLWHKASALSAPVARNTTGIRAWTPTTKFANWAER